MSHCLTNGSGWPVGYRIVSLLQIALTAILFFSLPLWKKRTSAGKENPADETPALGLRQVFQIPGAKYILLAFFGYSAVESTTSLWASSYLVIEKGITTEIAARYASLFFLGITFGRFLSGFVADKFGDRTMIRIGLGVIVLGILAMWLPLGLESACLIGLIIIGLGCAPVYPSIIHATPDNFGKENSQAMVGVQMAFAYLGTTLMPPLFGLIAEHINIALFPLFLMLFAVLMIVMTERLNRKKNV